jgi:glycine dehydrogenase subunit 2
MKYNPKINEQIANLESFNCIHPYQNISDIQGALEVLYELGEMLKEIIGLDAVTLQPSAGAHGNYVGCLLQKNILKLLGRIEEKLLFLIQHMELILLLQQWQVLR